MKTKQPKMEKVIIIEKKEVNNYFEFVLVRSFLYILVIALDLFGWVIIASIFGADFSVIFIVYSLTTSIIFILLLESGFDSKTEIKEVKKEAWVER